MPYVSLPEISDNIKVWFDDELQGRVFTALGDSISEDNMPALPLAAVISSNIGVNVHEYLGQLNGRLEIFDEFTVEFWLNPARHKRKDGTESPFWAYQDHMLLSNKLIGNMLRLADEKQTFFEFTGLNTSFVSGAVVFVFSFRQHTSFCVTDDMFSEPLDGFVVKVCAGPFEESKCDDE